MSVVRQIGPLGVMSMKGDLDALRSMGQAHVDRFSLLVCEPVHATWAGPSPHSADGDRWGDTVSHRRCPRPSGTTCAHVHRSHCTSAREGRSHPDAVRACRNAL
jgi:hypothetical protein